jgi:ATP synthase protein I
MKNKQMEEKKRLAAYSTVGLMFPASIAVGVAIGYFLDKLLKTSPYLLIIFALYGIAAGFVNLIKVTRQHEKRD